MRKEQIKKFIACNIPMSACNLKCHYCYISQLSQWERNKVDFALNPAQIEKALSADRLGGTCIINLTGKGETLIPKEMPEVIRRLLEQGHFLEVVTNGTLTNRFEEIAEFPRELLERLEFKFSFHYLELKERGWMERFFNNVNKMRERGCSFTLELMPNDEIVPYIEDIKRVCIENVEALCHLTIGRDDTDARKILTKIPIEEYLKAWQQFDSNMFNFKYSVFNVKRCEFCYAGMWSLYVDLATGDTRQCYGLPVIQNIYKDINKPLYYRPVGRKCRQPYCYNAHAFMSLGVIPEIDTPTYADIRDREGRDGNHWLTEKLRDAFASKLVDSNEKVEGIKHFGYYLSTPAYFVRLPINEKKKLLRRIKRKITGK